MDSKELSQKWNVSEQIARRIIASTTRLCPRNTSDITLNRRYNYNDRMLRYRHLAVSMFSDTMFTSQQVGKSIRNNACAQIFVTDFGWVCVYLMEFERDMGNTFRLLFKDFCVRDKMIMNGAKGIG